MEALRMIPHVEKHDSIEPAGHALTGYTDLQTTAEAHAAIEKEHNMTAMYFMLKAGKPKNEPISTTS
jgi:hypothetical protein